MFHLVGKGGEAKGFVAAFCCKLCIKRASGSRVVIVELDSLSTNVLSPVFLVC